MTVAPATTVMNHREVVASFFSINVLTRSMSSRFAMTSDVLSMRDSSLAAAVHHDLEPVFRSLKSELGLRPIFHQKEHRSKGHLFITVLAYQLVQVIRRRLGAQGDHSSWPTLRSILAGQQRVTATFRCADGRTLHVAAMTGAIMRVSAR